MSRELALQVRDLNVWYRPGGVIRRSRLVPVLHDISFDLWRGEALGLVGESGSGKSTLARTILGMVPDYTGTVTHYTKRPQMIFQDPYSSLNPSRTVGATFARFRASLTTTAPISAAGVFFRAPPKEPIAVLQQFTTYRSFIIFPPT